MCKPTRSHGTMDAMGGCCCCGPSFRRFITSKEELERLEEYQDQLKKELDAVAEHIKNLEKE